MSRRDVRRIAQGVGFGALLLALALCAIAWRPARHCYEWPPGWPMPMRCEPSHGPERQDGEDGR